MTRISVPLPDDKLARLRDLAGSAGLAPEEYLLREVERLLADPDAAFAAAAARVVAKNADLYRRLA